MVKEEGTAQELIQYMSKQLIGLAEINMYYSFHERGINMARYLGQKPMKGCGCKLTKGMHIYWTYDTTREDDVALSELPVVCGDFVLCFDCARRYGIEW